MTNTNNLPEDLLAQLDPVQVKEYAKATGWVREPRASGPTAAIFAHPTSDLDQIIVPLFRTAPHFARRMAEVVGMIAEKEKRPAVEVLNDLLLPPADVIRFSEAGPATSSGDVSLEHGLALLGGARKALLAAACSERRPHERFHPRMSLAEAEQFLEAARLGQTERGSYTITIACPLAAVPNPEPLLDRAPFTRRVTELLMRSLHRLALGLATDELGAILAPSEGDVAITANLCDGLLDMTPVGEGAILSISASWARTLPRPAALPIPAQVAMRQEWFPRIETLASQLRPTVAPRRQVLVGFVDTLDGRPNPEGHREGPVALRVVLPEGDLIHARADLSATDHHAAWEAYDLDQPVRVDGVLRRIGKSYRIDNVTSFQILQNEPAEQTETS